MGEGGGEIIIKGGSVEVAFADSLYPKDPNDPSKHKNSNRKITRIVVRDENGGTLYDSGTNNGGLKFEVTVSTK